MPVRRKKKTDETDFNKLFAGEIKRASEKSNFWSYVPHPKQILFHSNSAKERLYVGGNRSGKTVGGCIEDIYHLRGEHPYQKVPPAPVYGRIVGVDFDNGVQKILRPMIERWIPPSLLINGSWEDSYDKGEKVLNCSNGSTLEFMSYIQDVQKFAGTSRHFIHFDEEPPKPIYTECKLRTLDVGGKMWFTMTPVEGMTWIYDDIYLPGTTGMNNRISVVEVDVTENPYINTEEVEDFLEGMDSIEKQARKSGKFVQLGGLIFKRFGPHNIIPYDEIDFNEIRTWRLMCGMDHGFNNPTAWLWNAVSPDGRVITFHEHYQSEWTVAQHAQMVHSVNADYLISPEINIGDPAIAQRNAVTGYSIQVEYGNHGVNIVLANNDVRTRIDRMNAYTAGPNPQWQIADTCPNLISEMHRYRWKTWESSKLRARNNPHEEPHKKNDHAVDASGYFFTFLPDLTLKEEDPDFSLGKMYVDSILSPGLSFDAVRGIVLDRGLIPQDPHTTEWTTIDEYMGGEW